MSATGNIRVVVVDDHDLLREGVTACLSGFDQLEVVGVRDDLERLGPDRPGGAEHQQTAGHRAEGSQVARATVSE